MIWGKKREKIANVKVLLTIAHVFFFENPPESFFNNLTKIEKPLCTSIVQLKDLLFQKLKKNYYFSPEFALSDSLGSGFLTGVHE